MLAPGTYDITASLPTWPDDGLCSVWQTSVQDAATTYEATYGLYNVIGNNGNGDNPNYGNIGVAYNVVADDAYDFVLFRLNTI